MCAVYLSAQSYGQRADYRHCLTNGKYGYATISLARDARIYAPGYTVKQENAELFWAGKKNDPGYMITTDWGGVDGQYSPKRFKDYYGSVAPNDYTIDLDLTGVSEIRLVIDDGGNGNGSDHGNWADAHLK